MHLAVHEIPWFILPKVEFFNFCVQYKVVGLRAGLLVSECGRFSVVFLDVVPPYHCESHFNTTDLFRFQSTHLEKS